MKDRRKNPNQTSDDPSTKEKDGVGQDGTKRVGSRLRVSMEALLRPLKRVLSFVRTRKDDVKDVVRNQHRFVIMDTETYKEKFSFQLTGINLFVTIGVSIIVLVLLTTVIIAFTPLREFIPGYTNAKMTEQTYQNVHLIDSLEMQLTQQEQMLADIKAIMLGQNPDDLRRTMTTSDSSISSAAVYAHSKADSLLRAEVESADRYALQEKVDPVVERQRATSPVSMQLFFTPMKGKVISPYDTKLKHYGVDIAGAANEAVKSIMGGTVLLADFTVETGYVIVIQHADGYVSLYKHNSALLKHVGDIVRAGEPVAYLGNSGVLTSGPHLHFELWYQGKPVNPLHYISF